MFEFYPRSGAAGSTRLVIRVTPEWPDTTWLTLYFLWPWSLYCSQGRGGNHWPALTLGLNIIGGAFSIFPENCPIVVCVVRWQAGVLAHVESCCVRLGSEQRAGSTASVSRSLCFQPVAGRLPRRWSGCKQRHRHREQAGPGTRANTLFVSRNGLSISPSLRHCQI